MPLKHECDILSYMLLIQKLRGIGCECKLNFFPFVETWWGLKCVDTQGLGPKELFIDGYLPLRYCPLCGKELFILTNEPIDGIK